MHDIDSSLNSLKDILGVDKKPLSLLIGAGSPLGVKIKDWPLIPAIKELTEKINSSLKSDKKYSNLISELKKASRNPENIEDILDFLRSLKQVAEGSSVRGLSMDDLVNLEEKICAEISSLVNVELPNEETPYNHLSNWISTVERDTPIEIFTTNYDLLLEQAFEVKQLPYFDGFSGSRNCFFDLKAVEENNSPDHWIRLWKIHGSINWYRTSEGVQRMSGSLPETPNVIYPSFLKYDESRKMPYLALMDRLDAYLKQKSAFLLIIGYSFSDQHINNTIVNALRSNRTSAVYALLYDNLDIYQEATKLAKKTPNLSLYAKDKAVIGTSSGEWVKIDETKKENSDYLEVDKDGKVTLEIGDFNSLGSFLNSLLR